MKDEWQGRGLYLVLPSASPYARLSAEIDALAPRATVGSTTLFDLNRLLIERRRIWMQQNGLGPR